MTPTPSNLRDVVARAIHDAYDGRRFHLHVTPMFPMYADAALAAIESAGFCLVPREVVETCAKYMESEAEANDGGEWVIVDALRATLPPPPHTQPQPERD